MLFIVMVVILRESIICYAHRYNKAVFDLLKQEKNNGEAVVFARSATVGGQQYPVHWGGDNLSQFHSMADTLRGRVEFNVIRIYILES
jgi:alpha-glucosidase (family GH31 glycosyl hydrolase)